MKHIVYLSQFRDSSGYAVAARHYLKSLQNYILENKKDYTLMAHTLRFESGCSLSDEETSLIDSLSFGSEEEVDKFLSKNEKFVLLWHMPPPMMILKDRYKETKPSWRIADKLIKGSYRNINITVWEADKIEESWARVFDIFETKDVIVPCQWNKDTFEELAKNMNQDLTVYKIPHVIEESKRAVAPLQLDLDNKFVLFSMSQWNTRKGFDKLIEAFTMEFSHNKDVKLVIKTYDNLIPEYLEKVSIEQQAVNINKTIQKIRSSVFTPRDSVNEQSGPRVSNISLLPWLLPYENIRWLYEKADVFCLATRGEGFGLTISEAIMHEKPVIVPNKGGHLDYISESNKELLFDCHKSPYVGIPGYHSDMNWYEPDVISLRKKMRMAYDMWKNNKKALERIGKKNKRFVIESQKYSEHTVGKQIFDAVAATAQKELVTFREKIDFLKNKHLGEECVILTCGPSISKFSKEELNKITKNRKVIAIKQALEFLPEKSDYHFFNSNNFQLYDYAREDTTVFAVSGQNIASSRKFIWTNEQKLDIFLQVLDDKTYSNALCNSLDFDSYTFDKTMGRPWGPGIMAEAVIYFVLHAGFKNVYTIGWDLEKPGSTNSNHFYPNDREVVKPADPMKPDEIEKNITMSLELYKWLKTKGVNLYVSSPNSYVHPEVPRKLF